MDVHPSLTKYTKLPIDLITGRRKINSFISTKSVHVHPASYKGKKCEPSDLPEEHLHVERFHPAAVNKCAGLPKNEDLISLDVSRVHPTFYGRQIESVPPSKPEKPYVYSLTPSSVLLSFRVPAASGSWYVQRRVSGLPGRSPGRRCGHAPWRRRRVPCRTRASSTPTGGPQARRGCPAPARP